VVLAGGGTAGHVEPALAVADALRRADPSIRLTMLGTETGLETRLVPARGYDLRTIARVPLPRKLTPTLLTVPARAAGAVRAVSAILAEVEADVVVGFGGYVAFPAYLAARRRRCGIVVHEANPLPGLANRVGARLTRQVAVSTPATRLPHASLTGIPLRPALLDLDRAASRPAARRGFGLDPDRPTLLVFGGSQGARRINEAVAGAAQALVDAGLQVLHATGAAGVEAVRAALPSTLDGSAAPYLVVPYLDDMPAAYAAADLALCRSGALSCAELAAVGLPAIYVPLPIGNGEQRLNAEAVVAAGGALLVSDEDLDAEVVTRLAVRLLGDAPSLAKMAEAAQSGGHREAAAALVAMIGEAYAASSRGRSRS
jgi:UDP-N-acetylglucosamine--N-acetylmuramyl-(pentapeptide) pyrophosphoryl-undecaprenol N-acetylglucosamine transferase